MSNDERNFPFRIAIDGTSRVDGEPDQTTLQEFVRLQIEALLDIVVLTSAGKPISVDGFLWMKDAFRPTSKDPAQPFEVNRSE